MDLSKLSEQELKANAYDQLAILEQAKRSIDLFNQELNKRQEANNMEALKSPEVKKEK